MPRSLHMPITFADGDMVLRSSEGVEFRIDSVILRRASHVFSSMLDLPQKHADQSATPIELPETTKILDEILRALYSDSDPSAIESEADAIDILRALEKYGISSWPLETKAAQVIGAIQPSVRAWAVALQCGSNQARELAVRRFIADTTTGQEGDIEELKAVDAWRLVHLLQVKRQVRVSAIDAVNSIIQGGFCHQWDHRDFELHKRARANPFSTDLLAEQLLSAMVTGYSTPHCGDCQKHFNLTSSSEQRAAGRRKLEELMKQALDMEIQGKKDGFHLTE